MNAAVNMKRAQANKQHMQQLKKGEAERHMLTCAKDLRGRESDDDNEKHAITTRVPKRRYNALTIMEADDGCNRLVN